MSELQLQKAELLVKLRDEVNELLEHNVMIEANLELLQVAAALDYAIAKLYRIELPDPRNKPWTEEQRREHRRRIREEYSYLKKVELRKGSLKRPILLFGIAASLGMALDILAPEYVTVALAIGTVAVFYQLMRRSG